MTRMVMISRTLKPTSEDWNCCAVPSKLALRSEGRVCRAICSTRLTASPSEVPGSKLNDTVTDGNCPA